MTNRDTLIEIRILFVEDALLEDIRKLLGRSGIFPNELVEECKDKRKELIFYLKASLRAKTLGKSIAKAFGPKVTVIINKLLPDDWQTKWKKDYKSVALTPHFRMVPEAARNKTAKGGRKNIYIDTDLVFGSGTHPTTQEIAGFIDEKRGLFADFLDIGTGTGILSIVAAKCGAKRIWALDISAEAVDNAQENFTRNNCRADLVEVVDFKVFKRKSKFDFVAANLLTHDLIAFRDKILTYVNPGKYLAVSGISLCNYRFFRNKFDVKGLRCLRIKKSKEWCAVLYKKL